MTEETVVGANTAPAAGAAGELTSPVNDGFNRIDPTVDSISDIDGDIPVKVEPTQPAEPAKAEAKKAEVIDDRFDKHPRFQELLRERDNFKLELEKIKGQLSVLTPNQQQQAKADAAAAEAQKLPYKDITQMTKEELLEWQEDDPKGYAANLYQQMLHETMQTIQREQEAARQRYMQQQQQQGVKTSYENYAKANPDFMEKWNAGEIQRFMDAHGPLIAPNAITAHALMQATELLMQADERIKAEVAKAVKETEERVRRNFQAKRNAEVISDEGTVKMDGVPDELKNPEKYGGATAVGAMRLARMRQQAATGS